MKVTVQVKAAGADKRMTLGELRGESASTWGALVMHQPVHCWCV